MTRLLLISALLAQAASLPPTSPNPALTPGAVLAVTTEQVCTPGYARSVRSVLITEKRAVFARYGLTNTSEVETTQAGYELLRSDFEVDHLISLELGGSNAVENLWPESNLTNPWNAHVKDRLENKLHRLVCAGDITLAEAQRAIATDWIAAYMKYVANETATEATASTASSADSSATPAVSGNNPAVKATYTPVALQRDVNDTSQAESVPTSPDVTRSKERGMSDFLVFQELPWLRRALAYVLAFAVLWFCASVVAFLLSPVIRRLRSTFRDFLEMVAARQKQAHLGRTNAVAAEIDQLRATPHFRKLLRRSGETGLESDEVSGAFRPFFSAVQGAREVLRDAKASCENLRDSLADANVAAFQAAIPSASDIRAEHNTKRQAAVNVLFGVVFLTAVMTVNTGMLSQIVKDLNFVPSTYKSGSFQLYQVFAMVLTLVEVGTGWLFDVLQHRVRRDAPSTRLWPIFAFVLALTFASVEASFYSRVGGNSGSTAAAEDLIHVPGLDLTIPVSSFMFSWGFALVMVMFGSGMVIHNSLTELTQDAGLTSLRRRLGKAAKASASVTQTMGLTPSRA